MSMDINVQITAQAEQAKRSIDELIGKLNELKAPASADSKKTNFLSSTSRAVNSLSRAMDKLNGDSLKALKSRLESLNSLKASASFTELSGAVSKLGNALGRIGKVDVGTSTSNVRELLTGIGEASNGINGEKLLSISTGIQQIAMAFSSLSKSITATNPGELSAGVGALVATVSLMGQALQENNGAIDLQTAERFAQVAEEYGNAARHMARASSFGDVIRPESVSSFGEAMTRMMAIAQTGGGGMSVAEVENFTSIVNSIVDLTRLGTVNLSALDTLPTAMNHMVEAVENLNGSVNPEEVANTMRIMEDIIESLRLQAGQMDNGAVKGMEAISRIINAVSRFGNFNGNFESAGQMATVLSEVLGVLAEFDPSDVEGKTAALTQITAAMAQLGEFRGDFTGAAELGDVIASVNAAAEGMTEDSVARVRDVINVLSGLNAAQGTAEFVASVAVLPEAIAALNAASENAGNIHPENFEGVIDIMTRIAAAASLCDNQTAGAIRAIAAAMQSVARMNMDSMNTDNYENFGRAIEAMVDGIVNAANRLNTADLESIVNMGEAFQSLNGVGTELAGFQRATTQAMGAADTAGGERTASLFSVIARAARTAGSIISASFKGARSVLASFRGMVGRVGDSFSKLRDSLSLADTGLGRFLSKLGNRALSMGMRSIIKFISGGFTTGLQNLAKASSEAQATMNGLSSGVLSMQNAMGGALYSLLETVSSIVTELMSLVQAAFNAISQLFAILGGSTTYKKATTATKKFGDANNSAAGSAKKLKSVLMSFDEINALKDNSSSGGGSGSGDGLDYSAMFEEVAVSEDLLAAVRNADFTQIGSILAEKLNAAMESINWDSIKKKAKDVANSLATLINGFVASINAEDVGKTIAGVIDSAATFVATFWDTTNWSEIGIKIKVALRTAIADIEPITLGRAITGRIRAAVKLLTSLLPKDQTEWDTAFGKLKDVIVSAIDALNTDETLAGIAGAIKSVLVGAVSLVSNIASAVNESGGLTGMTSAIGAVIGDAINAIDTSTLATSLSTIIGDILGAIGNIVTEDNVSALSTKFLDFIESASEKLPDLLKSVATIGGNIIKGIAKSLVKAAEDGTLTTTVANAITGLFEALGEIEVPVLLKLALKIAGDIATLAGDFVVSSIAALFGVDPASVSGTAREVIVSWNYVVDTIFGSGKSTINGKNANELTADDYKDLANSVTIWEKFTGLSSKKKDFESIAGFVLQMSGMQWDDSMASIAIDLLSLNAAVRGLDTNALGGADTVLSDLYNAWSTYVNQGVYGSSFIDYIGDSVSGLTGLDTKQLDSVAKALLFFYQSYGELKGDSTKTDAMLKSYQDWAEWIQTTKNYISYKDFVENMFGGKIALAEDSMDPIKIETLKEAYASLLELFGSSPSTAFTLGEIGGAGREALTWWQQLGTAIGLVDGTDVEVTVSDTGASELSDTLFDVSTEANKLDGTTATVTIEENTKSSGSGGFLSQLINNVSSNKNSVLTKVAGVLSTVKSIGTKASTAETSLSGVETAARLAGEQAEKVYTKIVEIPSTTEIYIKIKDYANLITNIGNIGRVASALTGTKTMKLQIKAGLTQGAKEFLVQMEKFVSATEGMNIRNLLKLSQFANGGYPTRGDLFIANEAGAEMVGTIGGKTAVANQQEIGDAIFRYMDAHAEQNGGDGGIDENRLASAIVSACKSAGLGAIYLDGRQLADSINRETRRSGKPAVTW